MDEARPSATAAVVARQRRVEGVAILHTAPLADTRCARSCTRSDGGGAHAAKRAVRARRIAPAVPAGAAAPAEGEMIVAVAVVAVGEAGGCTPHASMDTRWNVVPSWCGAPTLESVLRIS